MARERRNGRIAIGVILAVFILTSFAYSVVNPLHEATDELRHYRFVRYVATQRGLPVQGKLECRAQGHHPPLFYTVAAVFTGWVDTGQPVCAEPETNPFWAYRYWEVGRDNKNQYLHGADETFPWAGEALAAHLARLVNVFIGAGVVWLTWAIGRAVWPERPWLAVGGAAFVAFNPMFAFMAGAVNNDVIAAFSGAALTLACVRLVRDEAGLRPRWGWVLGALFGVALLSKFNLLAMGATAAVAVTGVAWRRKQWRGWWGIVWRAALMTLLIAGWWFVRNQILYGEPTGIRRLTELWGVRDPEESWGVAIFELPYVWTSLWGRFGYGQVPLPQAIYDGLWGLTLFAGAGLLAPLLRRQWDEIRAVGFPLLLLGLNILLFFAVIFNYLLVSPAGPMGRFFFPALPSMALLMVYGLSQWGRRKGEGRRRKGEGWGLAVLLNAGMWALSLVALFGYLAPAYARPPAFPAAAELPNPVNVQFDGLVKLRGYHFTPEVVRPGEPVQLDLYWEVTGRPPGDFLLFVHLQDNVGMVAQRDTHPGLGHFPSRLWRPGDRFVESIRLYVPETAYTPVTATLSAGFYAADEGYRLGITGPDGTGLGDALPLGTVQIAPAAAEAPVPNPGNYNFDNEIRLAGYEYDQRQITAGQPLTVTLYWEALEDTPPDYNLEIELRQPPGEDWHTVKGEGRRPQPPTTSWTPGVITMTRRAVETTAVLPGEYTVHVALIDRESKAPQNIVAEDGHWLDDHLLLGKVQIRPPTQGKNSN